MTNTVQISTKELEAAFRQYDDKGLKDNLLSLVRRVVESYPIDYFHDLYWKLFDENTYDTHLKCYTHLRTQIFERFLNTCEDQQQAMRMFIIHDDRTKLITDEMVGELLRSGSTIIAKMENSLKEYDIAQYERDGDKFRFGIKSACTIDKLNSEQKKLLDHYEQFICKKKPTVRLKEIGGPLVLREFEITQPISSTNQDVLFRLYLLGDKRTDVVAYDYILYSNAKRGFDVFVDWFWRWAQRRKANRKRVPIELKKFCVAIMAIVSENNSYTGYGAGNFKTGIQFIDQAWDRFRTAANDAMRRIEKNRSFYFITVRLRQRQREENTGEADVI